MHKRNRQFEVLVVLVALAASAWSQTVHYTVPAAFVGENFSAYHQALDSAADLVLANVAREATIGADVAGVASHSAAQPNATILHQFAQQYWNGNDEAVRRAVARVRQLMPVLIPILREEGIPDDVVALVLVESAGNIAALSPKGARGVWQFMPNTARRLGLTVNSEADDRLDVPRSTRAAAQYLRSLYVQFDNWSLALAAYNAGEMAVRNAVIRNRSKDFALLSSKRLIPVETRAYVRAVTAAAHLLISDSCSAAEMLPMDDCPLTVQ